MADPIDTNVIVRYLVENPKKVAPRFRGVFPFFEKLERGERSAVLTPLVLFQVYFVLTSYYEVPVAETAAKLQAILGFRGLVIPERAILRACLATIEEREVDLADAYLAALCQHREQSGVYSFDTGLRKLGIDLLPVD